MHVLVTKSQTSIEPKNKRLGRRVINGLNEPIKQPPPGFFIDCDIPSIVRKAHTKILTRQLQNLVQFLLANRVLRRNLITTGCVKMSDETEVIGLEKLNKSFQNPPLDWNGDPCLPRQYSWTGVTCSEGSRLGTSSFASQAASSLQQLCEPFGCRMLGQIELLCYAYKVSAWPDRIVEQPIYVDCLAGYSYQVARPSSQSEQTV
ncbi:hypothetical protein RJ640_017711 [Escallonia rubra]|uniref:Leucine-rich repeat-containing N-terminal plant-type domain-containing protein n=1 Tax=Escallonia rubra TaxID=112253 RepID=A0AA88QCR8_9ASTE|nr:hypothetical protein RJ640_017711 [Escallonia rubra]